MRRILKTSGILAFLLGLNLLTTPAFAAEEKQWTELENRFGTVHWSHELHARDAVRNCQICHHTSKSGTASPPACLTCHPTVRTGDSISPAWPLKAMAKPAKAENGEKTPPTRRNAFHKSCQGCHMAVKKGPVKCRECHESVLAVEAGNTAFEHRVYALDKNIACTRCHTEGAPAKIVDPGWDDCGKCHESYVHKILKPEDRFDHGALFLGAPGEVVWDHRAHVLPEVMELGGESFGCLSCHHKEKDAKPQEYRTCRTCHKAEDAKAASGETVPRRGHALHKACTVCHDPTRKDLPETPALGCRDCHNGYTHLMPAEFGTVVWSHAGHGADAETACTDCHHADKGREDMRACRSCHMDDLPGNVLDLKMKTATQCNNCHKDSLEKPIEGQFCRACHEHPWSELVKAEKNFGEKHATLTMEKALHKTCLDCHAKKKKGPTDCRGCHAYAHRRGQALKYGRSDNGSGMPPSNIMSAKSYEIHRTHLDENGFPCLDCHHNLKPSARVAALKSHFPAQPNCKEGTGMDDCRPGLSDPQHCKNCHGQPGVPSFDEAAKHICSDCHKDFGIPPAEYGD